MHKRKPDWLKVKLQGTEKLYQVKKMLNRLSLNTVCEEANCPNIVECFAKKTATFMILGKICTRNCTYCNVTRGTPQDVDPGEPFHVAEAVKELGLKHVVITSVTRDDLPDGGASHFARVIEKIRDINDNTIIEVLIPDFQGDYEALSMVINANPHIINHNIETISRLYPVVRAKADYFRSLELLKKVKQAKNSIYTKSGMMLGLGEKEQEVVDALKDLRKVDCELLTIGQYLAPSSKHHPVIEYIYPETFDKYKELGYEMGFKYVASAPLVRSSYNAEEVSQMLIKN
ncbi:MAG: lipoyl synthase [Clostridiales bacterium]|nr:lipoyl synthase [Clostridiales bacterium]MCF8021099.1 lipoyl synthase [Clostridiales bacterium]